MVQEGYPPPPTVYGCSNTSLATEPLKYCSAGPVRETAPPGGRGGGTKMGPSRPLQATEQQSVRASGRPGPSQACAKPLVPPPPTPTAPRPAPAPRAGGRTCAVPRAGAGHARRGPDLRGRPLAPVHVEHRHVAPELLDGRVDGRGLGADFGRDAMGRNVLLGTAGAEAGHGGGAGASPPTTTRRFGFGGRSLGSQDAWGDAQRRSRRLCISAGHHPQVSVRRGGGRGRGGLGPKSLVYQRKITRQEFPDCKFYCLRQGTSKRGEGQPFLSC